MIVYSGKTFGKSKNDYYFEKKMFIYSNKMFINSKYVHEFLKDVHKSQLNVHELQKRPFISKMSMNSKMFTSYF